jgi:hypothetical protein
VVRPPFSVEGYWQRVKDKDPSIYGCRGGA